MNPRITLIVAVAKNGVIGANGALPWHIPQDLKRFKTLTLGKPIIMGRKTWDSLPRKPLPGRTNIVVTRDAGFHAEGAVIVHSIGDALARAMQEHAPEIMVIGGQAIFAATLPRATRIHWTRIMAETEGDAVMPPLDAKQWQEVAQEGPFESGGLHYAFAVLERRQLG